MSANPRLSRGVTVTRRQISDDEVYYLAREPQSGTFLRMGATEAALLRLLDGTRTAAQVGEELSLSEGVRIDTDVIEGFIDSMTHRGLVEKRGFDPIAFREEWRQQERKRRRSLGQLLGSVAEFKVKLFHPQRFFTWAVKPLAFVWTPGFVVFSLMLMCVAGVLGWVNGPELFRTAREFYTGMTSSAGAFVSRAVLFYITFFTVIAIHELSHGLTCARFGGKISDMGFILFYLQIPGVYCDITDAYSFEKRSHRLWTTVAGCYSGLVLASIGMITWWATEPGSFLNNVAIVMILVGGPPVLIINWNPLLKLDGYYILMDLLEAPNLMDNSKRYLGYLVKTRLLRVPVTPMYVTPRLRKAYAIYGLLNFLFVAPLMIYMPVIIYSLFAGMLGETIALSIAVVLAWKMLTWPARKLFETLRYAWQSHRPALAGASHGNVRLGLMGTGAVIAVLLMLFGPRFAVRVDGVGRLEPLERVEVRAAWPGFVQWDESSAIPDEGTAVHRGDLLVHLGNPEVEAQQRAVALDLASLKLDLSRMWAAGDPSSAAIRRADELSLSGQEQVLARRSDQLVLRAPVDGVILTPRLVDRLGAYIRSGDTWCVVGRIDRLRVRVPLSESALGRLDDTSPAEIKGLHLPGETFPGHVTRLPAGKRAAPGSRSALTVTTVPAPDLSTLAGSLQVEVEVDNGAGLLRPGMTARVRLYGERLSLAGHALRWAQRLFKGKVWW